MAKIAARFQTSVGAIAAANGIANVNTIYYGQSLVIPAPGTESSPPLQAAHPSTTVVRPGDTLSEIAVKYNSTVDAIKSANGLS
ncbi:MAG: LysM peptidoglycan-binding domain-containing protein [Chloroflexi bacterium]|nr:LysM peptidoglycan-binding domain-containing protein [Chloroflexota bacterium]